MSERKLLEVDTTPETPRSKGTLAVRTGRSDPPPSMYPTPRPAAGMPAHHDLQSSPRSATTLPRPVKAQPATAALAPSARPLWLGAAVFAMVLSAIVVFALHG